MSCKSGTFGENIDSCIGSSVTHRSTGTAKFRSVKVLWIEEKSVIFPNPKAGNSPYSAFASGVLTSVSSIGLRVTMFEPFGKNSWPTIASSTELLPDDWDPITTIDGNVNVPDCPMP